MYDDCMYEDMNGRERKMITAHGRVYYAQSTPLHLNYLQSPSLFVVGDLP